MRKTLPTGRLDNSKASHYSYKTNFTYSTKGNYAWRSENNKWVNKWTHRYIKNQKKRETLTQTKSKPHNFHWQIRKVNLTSSNEQKLYFSSFTKKWSLKMDTAIDFFFGRENREFCPFRSSCSVHKEMFCVKSCVHSKNDKDPFGFSQSCTSADPFPVTTWWNDSNR